MKQHVQHEGKRLANEVDHNGRVAVGGVLPKGTRYVRGMRATGTIAFATIYMQSAGKAPREKSYYVERCHKGVWVTAERSMQGRNIEEARNICKALPGYRLVVRNGLGAYTPVKP